MAKQRYQKPKRQNPALSEKLIEQRLVAKLNEARRGGIEWASLAFEVMSLMVLHDKFGITDKEELKRYCNELGGIADAMNKDYANLSDFVKALNEESGFTLSDDDLAAIDPGLVGYMASND